MLDAQQKEILRENLLLQLDRGRIAQGITTLSTGLRISGFDLTNPEIEKELQYLLDLGLVEEKSSELSMGNVRYRITAKGTQYLESRK